jgi:hypothetical protein
MRGLVAFGIGFGMHLVGAQMLACELAVIAVVFW